MQVAKWWQFCNSDCNCLADCSNLMIMKLLSLVNLLDAFDKVKVVKSSKTKNQAYVVGMLRASVSYVRTIVRPSAYFPYVRVQYVLY